MYRPVTEEIPSDEICPDSPVAAPVGEGEGTLSGSGVDRDDQPDEVDHSAVSDPGVEFSSSRSNPGLTAQQPRNRIQLKWEPYYLTTLPGIMKILQLVSIVFAVDVKKCNVMKLQTWKIKTNVKLT